MAKRPCVTPRCPNLTTRTRCPACEQQHQHDRNHARADRYDTTYRHQRAALLATHPTCHWGCGQPATTADHHNGTLVPACGPCNYQRGGIASGEARRARAAESD